VPASCQDSEDALSSGGEDALLRPLRAGLLGLRRPPCREISARSGELLSRGLWSKAKLEPKGRGDERAELEGAEEPCQGVMALTLGRQMQVVKGGCRERERHWDEALLVRNQPFAWPWAHLII